MSKTVAEIKLLIAEYVAKREAKDLERKTREARAKLPRGHRERRDCIRDGRIIPREKVRE